ncbi:MAG TPA: FAD-dependent monooxygenase [Streptomyces sp.]|nr:FAD-dependent monooxygenase [Streptomyces sp.]
MSAAPHGTTEVLVVGAGPTGLLLAGDLAAAGVDVTLVERRPDGLSNLSRAFAVHARSLEQLDARGLADELVATGATLDTVQLFGRLTLDLARLPGRFPFVLVTPQYEVERLLRRRAAEAGVRFRYGTEVTGLTQDDAGVTAALRDADGRTDTLGAQWAVGTDGVHSRVREALGLPFPGRSVLRSVVLADVRLTHAPESLLTVGATADAFAALAPFGDDWYRVVGWSRDRQTGEDTPVDLAEVRRIARRALGTDHGMHDARWLSRFHSDERQVPAYRVGRVLLAGDAAHVHSPAGGQGMNTGLQDAANLSWKLAAVVRGRSGPALLDTYHAERHPVGRMVLRSSGAIVRFAVAHTPARRGLRRFATMLGQHVPPVARKAIESISGIGIAYGRAAGDHPLTGRRAPDLPLAAGRLYEALRTGRFVLVVSDGDRPTAAAGHPVDVVRRRAGGTGARLLVRPDGYVAWAGGTADDAGLRAALTAWTGTADEPVSPVRR